MTDLTASSPLSSFSTYRRKQALASIAQELHRRASLSAPEVLQYDGGTDPVAVPAGLHRLVDSPDPSRVFAHLAELLVPSLSEEATAIVHVGVQAAAWQELSPVTADPPVSRVRRDGPDWVLPVVTSARPTDLDGDVSGLDSDVSASHYVAVLTCRGGGQGPTGQEVALIESAARHAAAVVHQARQRQLLHEQQERIGHLLVALDSNRMISAAVGVLIATHRLTYEQAFDMLTKTSQATNRKLATVAEMVLLNAFTPVNL